MSFILDRLNSTQNKTQKTAKNKIRKTITRILQLLIILMLLAMLCINVKLKVAYAVTIDGKLLGYVKDEDEFEKRIKDEILTNDEEGVAFVSLDNRSYELEYVDYSDINDEYVFNAIENIAQKIYRVYEVTNGSEEDTVYVNSMEEANAIVEEMKEKYNLVDTDSELAINTLYLNSKATDEAIEIAKANLDETLQEEQIVNSKTVNGVYLEYLPVTGGTISSRFGSRESVRNHVHKGLDIAANYGTPIVAVANGTVKFAGYESGYGNLVIIDHGNGVETYYGHCSKLLVSSGQSVLAGDTIAKVGSTGNSTGNHCHFEIRINDVQVNPQNYLYN